MYCNACGKVIAEDGRFCSYCGNVVGSANSEETHAIAGRSKDRWRLCRARALS